MQHFHLAVALCDTACVDGVYATYRFVLKNKAVGGFNADFNLPFKSDVMQFHYPNIFTLLTFDKPPVCLSLLTNFGKKFRIGNKISHAVCVIFIENITFTPLTNTLNINFGYFRSNTSK
ncbi:hypothetical protein BAZSYMA_ACONTIG00233_0 [Bathymodiolus azoricus thioautotrophic gill symbiont]|uniref:Uncharacterized protein n=1 Tax=Bathymodiolus azoricus thioautotrophic gill symbiont TaxID=235205 RepID=A0A1H6M290_9GAMM|nr:hypothetical protein BAZSYMA_ACONTIG00233_0 [Bathymodiolus azoricus thioautotrophic gill symbiont]